ncbi:MAG TPA: hypothetical protein VI864_02760 [Candidatus Bathyarchaeia archaeon]|nr:hypothetical protein [Candidatus Bathyarchaeia archaeon]
MSVRYLYQTIPRSKRICNYHRCQQPILRNIARDKNGAIYHYGCLQSARDEKWRCRECFLIFDATEASFEETQIFKNDEFRERYHPICPHCGSHNLKAMSRRPD